jgi:hypothetical protein
MISSRTGTGRARGMGTSPDKECSTQFQEPILAMLIRCDKT